MIKNIELIFDAELESLSRREPLLVIGHIPVLYNMHASLIEGEMANHRMTGLERAFASAIQGFDAASLKERFYYLRYMSQMPAFIYMNSIGGMAAACEARKDPALILSLCKSLMHNVEEYKYKVSRTSQ